MLDFFSKNSLYFSYKELRLSSKNAQKKQKKRKNKKKKLVRVKRFQEYK